MTSEHNFLLFPFLVSKEFTGLFKRKDGKDSNYKGTSLANSLFGIQVSSDKISPEK